MRVLSVHNRAVNLVLEDGEILTLVHPSLGNGPGTLLVPGPWPLPVQAGEQGELTGDVLRLGPLRLDLGAAPGWRPPDPPTPAPALRIRLQEAAAALAGQGGLVPAVLAALDLSDTDATGGNPFAAAAAPGLAWLKRGRWAEALKSLVGLGPGLTPGGDDLLCGYLVALQRMRHPEAAALGRAVSALQPEATTPISMHLLRWAARGVAGEHHLAWLDALLTGDPDAPRLLRTVLAHGATSGAEWVGGALLALHHHQIKENA